MYESFFGLREPAFALAPDPRFLWASETHEEGLAVLQYGISQRKGFLLLTGEVGSGKTTLLYTVLGRLAEDTECAVVSNTASLGPLDLLKLVANEFRIPGELHTKSDLVLALNRYLFDRIASGRNTVLIVDEAQNLDVGSLEEVRLLSNVELPNQKCLQIVLMGQPELRDTLAAPVLRPLRQRIALEHHIQPLTPEEVGQYLRHRIEVAGGRFEDVFEPGAAPVFASYSAGWPRLVNILADRVLLAAYAKQVRPVPPELIRSKAASLELARGIGSDGASDSGEKC